MSRKLASIQRIIDINPIEGADRIEVATILGWRVVIRKNEFKVNDLCVYFEVDSLIPLKPWSQFLEDKNKPGQPVRLRTIRLCKQLSQGLAVPISILDKDGMVEETDVTELLGIEKYEPIISAHLAGKVRGIFPALVPRTDEERLQSSPNLLTEFKGKKYVMTLKCDGTSGSFMNIEGDHHVCSRNLSLQDDGVNTYWKMYHKYNLKEVLDALGDFAIQGEVCGPSIQKNRLGLKDQELFVFDVFDIRAGRRVCFDRMIEICNQYGLSTVPIDSFGTFEFETIDELIEYSNSRIYPSNGLLAEGIVVRPMEEFYSEALSSRASFKVISNAFLEEYGE